MSEEIKRLTERVTQLEASVKALQNLHHGDKQDDVEQQEKLLDDTLETLDSALTNMLEVTKKEGELRVSCKQWLSNEQWNIVNKVLKQAGFTWHSMGKNSYWS